MHPVVHRHRPSIAARDGTRKDRPAASTVTDVLWSGPDSAGRRRRLWLLVGIEGVLGLSALAYGIVTALWASTVIGAVLLVFAAYSVVVLIGLRRRGAPPSG
jgi:hypothetical protein